MFTGNTLPVCAHNFKINFPAMAFIHFMKAGALSGGQGEVIADLAGSGPSCGEGLFVSCQPFINIKFPFATLPSLLRTKITAHC